MIWGSTFISVPELILKSTMGPSVSIFVVQSLIFQLELSELMRNVGGSFENYVSWWGSEEYS